MTHLIAPSVLSCDFANMQRDTEMINNSNADWFHVDVMDGVFVPNISFGFPILKAIKKHAKKTIDVHLMIVNPDQYIEEFAKSGADVVTVHYEACPHLHRTIQLIHSFGMKAGVALNPHTDISVLSSIIKDIDMVLIMSVNPGFGGQKFIENTIEKVKSTKELINSTGSQAIIQVDGGVNLDTGSRLVNAGAQVLVAGSFVFNSDNPSDTITALKEM